MSKTTEDRRRARKFIAGAAIVAAPAALLALSSATASADEVGVERTVTSRQGTVSDDATYGEVRGAEEWLHAQGEVRDSMKAVPDRIDGTRARGFLPSWSGGPSMGSW